MIALEHPGQRSEFWTGRTDDAKRDIFEGDIVETENQRTMLDGIYTSRSVVEYHPDLASWRIRWSGKRLSDHHPLDWFSIKSIKVIGNVHEHAKKYLDWDYEYNEA